MDSSSVVIDEHHESASSSSGEETMTIKALLDLLRTSTDREEIIETIEDLRTQARGNGMLKIFSVFISPSRFIKRQNWSLWWLADINFSVTFK